MCNDHKTYLPIPLSFQPDGVNLSYFKLFEILQSNLFIYVYIVFVTIYGVLLKGIVCVV